MNLLCLSSLALVASLDVLQRRRSLQSLVLAGYEPLTNVLDYANLDQDVEVILEQTGTGNFGRARNVYRDGGHSRSFARLTILDPGLDVDFTKDSMVTGLTENENTLVGHLLEDVSWNGLLEGSTPTIDVAYEVGEAQSEDNSCQVGGLFTVAKANRDGCFSSSGVIEIQNQATETYAFNYTYDVRRDNDNLLSMKGLSTKASLDLAMCSTGNCTQAREFQLFVDFYGDEDYGDKWIVAAAEGNTTMFSSGRGNADFSAMVGTRGRGRAEAFERGMIGLNLWMSVVQHLRRAVFSCSSGCSDTEGSDCALHDFDSAAALYVGILEEEDGQGEGRMLYNLANEFSPIFKTGLWAGNGTRGTAHVNLEALFFMEEAQSELLREDPDCDIVESVVDNIIQLITVPLVQGTLIGAWRKASETISASQESAISSTATFAACLLPLVDACSPSISQQLFDNIAIGSEQMDFLTVKELLEVTYPCLGITCAQVGGIWNGTAYEQDAAPCFDGKPIMPRFTEAPTMAPVTAPPTGSPVMESPPSEPTSWALQLSTCASFAILGSFLFN